MGAEPRDGGRCTQCKGGVEPWSRAHASSGPPAASFRAGRASRHRAPPAQGERSINGASGHGARGSHTRAARRPVRAHLQGSLDRRGRVGLRAGFSSPSRSKAERRPWHGLDRLALRSASLRDTTRGSEVSSSILVRTKAPPDRGGGISSGHCDGDKTRTYIRIDCRGLAGATRARFAPRPTALVSRAGCPPPRRLAPAVHEPCARDCAGRPVPRATENKSAIRVFSPLRGRDPRSEQGVQPTRRQALPGARRAGWH